MLSPQFKLDINHELIIDNFAGGGGASTGIEMGLGRHVDVAINHKLTAILMHQANHPQTEHYCESVWDVDPREVTQGRPVGLVWLSPDCRHFSKAKGGKPVDKNVRGLAWIAVRWAAIAKPRMIALENVEEITSWGRLGKDGKPSKKDHGREFNCFINALKRHGYEVEYRVMRGCDYGAPTIRRRLFLIARRDGLPICWPAPTHGDPNAISTRAKKLKPWKTAADIIDWSLPCPSIFGRKKSLAESSRKRIAKSVMRYVVDAERPFAVPVMGNGTHGLTSGRGKQAAAFMARNHGNGKLVLQEIADRLKAFDDQGEPVEREYAFLLKYYGTDQNPELREPLHTITTKHRFALVVIRCLGSEIVDIGLRMLSPRELYRGQGFPDNYIIGDDISQGLKLTQSDQVSMVGNSVCPVMAARIVQENLYREIGIERRLTA